MARGGRYSKLPSNIYFLEQECQSKKYLYGPYMSRPTLLQKDKGGLIIEFAYSKLTGNYERIQHDSDSDSEFDSELKR